MNRTELWVVAALLGCSLACSAGGRSEGAGTGASSNAAGNGFSLGGAGPGAGGSGISLGGGTIDPGGRGDENNPSTCQQAAAAKTYIGCDFWPTVTFNPVYTDFEFAVVVANAGSAEAQIKVERGGASVASTTVPPGGLKAIPLPWVMELKGEEFARSDTNTGARKNASVLVPGGAYHLTSSVPVTAWQFSPLDYQQAASKCPGIPAAAEQCLSVSNDASLLIPSTAMTGTYRLAGRSARLEGGGELWTSSQGAFAITATQDDTEVDVQLSPARVQEVGMNAKIGAAVLAPGPGVTAGVPGQTMSYTLQAGDVLQLVGQWAAFEPEPHGDLSGSLLNSSKPVQVIALNPLLNGVPTAVDGNPDHIEETVLPAEVIGKSYIVAAPTGPDQRVPGHMVRFFGNVDGTSLSYPEGVPLGAPNALGAGEVVEIGPLTAAFVVEASQPFSVASIMLGGTRQDPGGTRGDPSMTTMVTPEQFRTQYTFLAPTTYLENYADIVLPTGASVTLDGQPLTGMPEAIGTSGWSLVREPLMAGNNDGAHRLEASVKVGLQVLGFGLATSYCYPGGLDLKLISEPPVIVK